MINIFLNNFKTSYNYTVKINNAITQKKNIKEKINNFNINVEYISKIF